MKKIIVVLIFISISLCSVSLTANAHSVDLDFYQVFEEHGSVILLIDSETGAIEHANEAASDLYGYTIEELESMDMYDINVLEHEEIERRMESAAKEQKSYFTLQQRLADGDIRTVEVYSCPHTHGDKTLLFAIIHDVTDRAQLRDRNKLVSNILISVLSGVVILICLFIFILRRNLKDLKDRNYEIENLNELRETFIDSYDKLIYLKDENSKYVFVNKHVESLYKRSKSQIIGSDDFSITDKESALHITKTDREVISKKKIIVDEITIGDKIYKNIKFPVKLLNGEYGVGGYAEDITEENKRKTREKKSMIRNQILVNVLAKEFDSTREQLDYALNELLKLTESKYGYIYLYDEDNRELTLNSWSKGVVSHCVIPDKQTKHKLEDTGLWGEAVRQRKPVIINDYETQNHMKKGYPEGHVEIDRFMSIPVIIDNKIVAVVGLANKEEEYDYNDVYQMTALMSGIWNAKERRETLANLAVERSKFLQTLISIGEGVMVVDLEGKVAILNKVAQKLTGWTFEDARDKHYKEVFVLSHEDEKSTINDPIEEVLKTNTIQELSNHAVLTSKDGTKYYVEDSAAPIKDRKNTTYSVVVVFRDVTEQKEQRKRIEHLSLHDALTGLCNRGCFEEELKRIDLEENLPISIISGDMNGLKLANDIFGHEVGDMLLRSAADLIKKVCRKSDKIARVGGDEFTVILPKTRAEDAEKIIERIRDEFSKVRVKAIHGSMSMGCDTKTHTDENILQILKNAESRMYTKKAVDRSKIKSSTIEEIIEELHKINSKEEEHSINVSRICEKIGKRMGLPEDEVRRLKEAGYLHDIGKVALDEDILNSDETLTDNVHKAMKQHTVIGYRILNSFDDTLDLGESIMAHHERWDGSGYPKGLKGEEIPRTARIISVVESYDAMTNKKEMSVEEAILELKRGSGIRYDPNIVDIFVEMILEDKKSSERSNS